MDFHQGCSGAAFSQVTSVHNGSLCADKLCADNLTLVKVDETLVGVDERWES